MRKKIFIIIGVVLAVFIVGKIIWGTIRLSPVFFQFLFNKSISLKKADHNINLLILGIAGGKHDGPNLTDTIIFASIDPEKNKVTLVSIPRDLWVPDLNSKINKAYAEGEAKAKGGGLVLTKAVVSKITGQPIDYGFRSDFNGFVKAVDLIGGIEILVERSFDDYEYPIEGKENDVCGRSEEEITNLATSSSQIEIFPCRYLGIHFNKGIQTMNGETALKFVRSRHANGEEGTDFARSQRQEKVIIAFKNKILSAPTLLNPIKLISLYSVLSESIDTDIKIDEFDDFARLFQKMKSAKVNSAILDYGDETKGRPGLLKNPPINEIYGNQWVLIPRIGNGRFSEIQKYIDCEIKSTNCSIPVTP